MPISTEVKLQRRRKLLARTRKMIMEVGADNLNIRELAKYCDISVPTIYNQFRNKDDLIIAAADELFRWHFEEATPPEDVSGLDEVFFIADSTAKVFLENQELTRLIVTQNASSAESLAKAQNRYLNGLKRMRTERQLVDWIDINYLAASLSSRLRSMAEAWANGRIPDKTIIPLRHCEIALTLLGVSKGSARKDLERILRQEIPKFRD